MLKVFLSIFAAAIVITGLLWVVESSYVPLGTSNTKPADDVDAFHSLFETHKPLPMEAQTFDSLEEAGVYAEQIAYDMDNKFEEGGSILVDPNGKYHVTHPMSTQEEAEVVIDHVYVNGDMKIVGAYHSHTCLPYTHLPGYFSDIDVRNSISIDVPEFIANQCTGDVKEYDPHFDIPATTTILFNDGEDGRKTLTPGRVVGKIQIYKMPTVVEKPIEGKVPHFNSF